jgi:glutamate-5-semialdehyde dehydrogenase
MAKPTFLKPPRANRPRRWWPVWPVRAAQVELARLSDAQKSEALLAAAAALRAAEPAILAANAQDVAAGEARGLSGAMLDRLRLDPKRLAGIADAVAAVATLPDPVGQVIDASERPNG